MSHLDKDVSNIFKESELKMTGKIISLLNKNNININNLVEKIHIIIGIIDNLCHEVVYHNHSSINYDIMKDEVINIIIKMLKTS